MDIDMFYRLIHKVCLSSNECSYYDKNDNWFICIYFCRRMSALTMMITTIGLYIYVLLSSNECSYYDDNDNWFIYICIVVVE